MNIHALIMASSPSSSVLSFNFLLSPFIHLLRPLFLLLLLLLSMPLPLVLHSRRSRRNSRPFPFPLACLPACLPVCFCCLLGMITALLHYFTISMMISSYTKGQNVPHSHSWCLVETAGLQETASVQLMNRT